MGWCPVNAILNLALGATTMSDIGELKQRAENLVQHISQIQSELRSVDIETKIDDIKSEIKGLRDRNDRLRRENDELKSSLKSLISSVEKSQLSDLPGTFREVRNKIDAVLKSDRIDGASTEPQVSARLAVVAEVAETPEKSQAEATAEKEPDRWNVPSGAQRTPGSKS